MSNPNDPFPVPPEGAPHSSQPPYAGPPQHGAPPYQSPYGGPPPHQPYGGLPQPPYGPPSAGNSKVLIWVIASLGLVIVIGAVLIVSGAFSGGNDGSTASPKVRSAQEQESIDYLRNVADSRMKESSYSSNSTSGYGSGDLTARVGDVAEAMHAQTPTQAGPLTIRNVRQVNGTGLEVNAEIPRSMSPSEFPFLERELLPNICASPAGALARQGATVTVNITESSGYRHPMRVSC